MLVKAVNLDHVMHIASRLEPLGVKFAFIGGSVIGLLVDHPEAASIRPTNDIDVVLEVVTHIDYTKMEKRLFGLKFKNDISEGAPKCRWIVDDIKVDVLPSRDDLGQWRGRWFEEALRTATPREISGKTINVVTASCFIATKMDAFADRGNGDFLASRDVEDIVAIVDGRASLESEIFTSHPDLRRYVSETVRTWLEKPEFIEALQGHLPGDTASQQRLPNLVKCLQRIGNMARRGNE